jgi:hypothetical protein
LLSEIHSNNNIKDKSFGFELQHLIDHLLCDIQLKPKQCWDLKLLPLNCFWNGLCGSETLLHCNVWFERLLKGKNETGVLNSISRLSLFMIWLKVHISKSLVEGTTYPKLIYISQPSDDLSEMNLYKPTFRWPIRNEFI